MADTTLPGVMLTGNHAGRPAATAVATGTLYSCSTHSLVYQSDGATWSTWATLGGGAPAAHAASHQNGGSDEIDVTGLTGAGGGGLTQAYVGKNAIGASFETPTSNRLTCKKVTLANAALLTSIELHLKYNGGAAVVPIETFLWDDNGSGTAPDHLLAYTEMGPYGIVIIDADGSAPHDGRWMSGGAIGRWLPAADYWIGWCIANGGVDIAYDTGGSDPYKAQNTVGSIQRGVDWGFSNANWGASTDSTRDYSIRANTIR